MLVFIGWILEPRNEQPSLEATFESKDFIFFFHCGHIFYFVYLSGFAAAGPGCSVSQRTCVQRSVEKPICGTTDSGRSWVKALRNELQLLSRKCRARKRSDACGGSRTDAICAGRRGFLVYHNRSCRQGNAGVERFIRAATLAARHLSEIA